MAPKHTKQTSKSQAPRRNSPRRSQQGVAVPPQWVPNMHNGVRYHPFGPVRPYSPRYGPWTADFRQPRRHFRREWRQYPEVQQPQEPPTRVRQCRCKVCSPATMSEEDRLRYFPANNPEEPPVAPSVDVPITDEKETSTSEPAVVPVDPSAKVEADPEISDSETVVAPEETTEPPRSPSPEETTESPRSPTPERMEAEKASVGEETVQDSMTVLCSELTGSDLFSDISEDELLEITVPKEDKSTQTSAPFMPSAGAQTSSTPERDWNVEERKIIAQMLLSAATLPLLSRTTAREQIVRVITHLTLLYGLVSLFSLS